MLKILFSLFVIFILSVKPVLAIFDPLSVPNNKFGIHIIDENDLVSASHLVNSSGGDWGYVTMVITENDKNIAKWSAIFKSMQKLHLIPVIRLATKVKSDFWETPSLTQADSWAEFLNALPWPAKNRFVVIFNEPNHAKEWGNKIEPENYAEILVTYSLTLKNLSDDFFILPAGLDASAPNSKNTMDEVLFLKRAITSIPNLLNYIDGWTSHSYPNPGFSGRVSDRGRGTLTSYKWELNLIRNLGFSKQLPVFITETGWIHAADSNNRLFLDSDQAAQNYVEASVNVWSDPQVVLISPFLLNYQAYPFVNFSWQKTASNEFYPQFDAYRSIDKVKGEPALNLPTPTPSLTLASNQIHPIYVPKTESHNSFLTSILFFFKKIVYASS